MYNNCISQPFFTISPDNVRKAGLHITLGIFNRLFDLLERKCQELDLALASQQVAQGGETFNRYIAALKRHGDLEEELMVTVPEPLENGVVQGVIENKDAFFKSLEVSLQKLHVQRQSFHGAKI